MASRISGITIEIDGNTTNLQKSLKSLDSSLSKTQGSLRDINRLLKLDPTNTQLLAQKQKSLESAIQGTKLRLNELKTAQEGIAQGSEEWDRLQREIIATEQKLKSLEKEHRQFGSVAAQQIAAVGQKMQTLGTAISNAGQQLTTKVTLPLAAVGAVGVKSFAEVDKTMQLANKTMGNTEEEAKLLDDAMKEAAANSTFGMSDAATATLNFARAGLDAEQAAAALAPAMNLAAGEGGNLDTVSAGLVATINSFQGSFDDASRYADVFAAACNNSALDVDSLASAMSTAGPVFKAAGYTVEDAALYMGVMANNGIEASEAANALKSGFSRLLPDAEGGKTAMEKFGWSILDAEGNMKDSVTVQRELHDAFSGLSDAEKIATAQTMFGTNQYSKWLALIETAPDDVDKLSDSIENSAGVTEEMSEAMMGGFGGSIEKLKSSLDVLSTSLGQLLSGRLQPIIDKVQSWVDKFNALDEGTKNTITTIGIIVAAIGPLLLIGGKLITGIGMLLTFAPMVATAFSFITGPVGIVIAIIAALIAIGVLLYKNWDKIKAAALELKNKVVEAWNGIVTGIQTAKDNVIAAWAALKANVSAKVEEIKADVLARWEALKNGVTSKIEALKNGAVSKFNNLKSRIAGIIQTIKGLFNFEWKLPTLKVPHITVDGGEAPWGIGGKGRLPQFNVQWYKSAYQNPVMFTSPTVLATPAGYKGFGDGNGAEIVMGLDRLRELVGSMGNGEVVVNVYLQGDARQMFKVVRQTNNVRTKATNFNALAAGGAV